MASLARGGQGIAVEMSEVLTKVLPLKYHE